MRAILCMAILLAIGTPAIAGDNELALGFTTRGLNSSSAQALTDSSLEGGQLAYARALPVELASKLQLWAVAGFGWGGASGTLFQAMTTGISTDALTAGARARYVLHPRVVASAHLDLGAERAAVTLSQNGMTYSDARWSALASGALGVDVMFVARSELAFGARVELGYAVASSVELSPHGASPSSDTLTLPAMSSPLGHLDLGGPWFGVSLVGQL